MAVKKIECGEFIKQLGFGLYGAETRLAMSVAAAYSDCLPENVKPLKYSDYGSGRNLSYLAPDAINLKSAKPLFDIIGEYNGFNPETSLAQLISVFGEDAKVRIAREGSPCFYITPARAVWFGRRSKIDELGADEVSFEPDTNTFRVWWD